MANKDKKNVKRFAENISKEMAEDAYNGGGGIPTLINFDLFRPWTRKGVITRYPAEINMTWNDYVNSDYNTADLYVNENGKLAIDDTTTGINTIVEKYDVISGQTTEVLGTEQIIPIPNVRYTYQDAE